MEENRQKLCDLGYEESIVFENPSYDSAISGVSEDGKVIYDYDKMVEHLVEKDHMTEEDAAEFIDYNTIRALPYAGEMHPIVLHKLID